MDLIARRTIQELEGDEGQKHLEEYADASTERGKCMLKTICEKLGFDDVTCIHSRAEEIPAGFRQGFDFALSRAVARLNLLCELCLPYVKKGGAFIAMKGSDLEEELAEARRCIRTLGGQVEKKIDYTIPGTDVTHRLVVVEKIATSPVKYPRAFAKIKKNPL